MLPLKSYNEMPRLHNKLGEPRFISSRKFTEKIVTQGGNFRDTTLYAATRKKEKEKLYRKQPFQPVENITKSFEEEFHKVKKMQAEIFQTKQYMAERLLQWYSALTIQSAFRLYRSYYRLKILKAIRFLSLLISFKFYFRKRVRCKTAIVKAYRSYRKWKGFRRAMKFHRAAVEVQRWYRHKRNNFLISSKLVLLHQVKLTKEHVLLFGERKAFHYHLYQRQPEMLQIKKNPILQFMLNCSCRRRKRL
jgi:hypothetical protein